MGQNTKQCIRCIPICQFDVRIMSIFQMIVMSNRSDAKSNRLAMTAESISSVQDAKEKGFNYKFDCEVCVKKVLFK